MDARSPAPAAPLRGVLLVVFLLEVFLSPDPVRAYQVQTVTGGALIAWKSGSPSAIWDDTNKVKNWSFNTIHFPQNNWPTAAQAGAAFQNAFQSIQDIPGAGIRFNRLVDTTGTPMSGDGKSEMAITPDEQNDYFGGDLTNAFAVTYVIRDATTGALQDADIVFNGDARTFTWATTGPPAPNGTNDIEVTAIHEGLHSIGSGHPIYFAAAVWPIGRFPEVLILDRDYSPDDYNLVRTLYPGSPAVGTVTGTVTLSAGGAAQGAVIVATDATGIPQATQVTDAGGAFSINVPAGTYSITAHHHLNSTYDSPGDINFASASPFLTSTTASGSTGGAAVALTVTSGTPTMTLNRLTTLPTPLESQIQRLDPSGATQTLELEITGPPSFAATDITNVSLGPGVTIGTVTASSGGATTTLVDIDCTVVGGAAPGFRSLTFTRVSTGERLFLPSYVMIPQAGGLGLSAGAVNPASSSVAGGATGVPLLQVTLTATGVETVRIRELDFALSGTGPTLPGVRLYVDTNGNGVVDAGEPRVFTGNAWSSGSIGETMMGTPPGTVVFDNLAFSLPAGGTVTLLLVADIPASGAGDYVASLAPAGITAHGMVYADVLSVTGGSVTGGTITVGPTAVGGLGQFRTTLGTAIPVGGVTGETQVTLEGTATASTGLVGMEVEAKPLGTAFDGTGTVLSAATAASGTTIRLTVTGLADATSYHWRARGLNSGSPPSAWVSFGGNPESAVDFSVDTSSTAAPTALGQFVGTNPAQAVALGGAVPGEILLSGVNGLNSASRSVRLEVEVEPAGTPFTNTPSLLSAFGPSGGQGSVTFTGVPGDYHWQARSSDTFGQASSWVIFNPATIHFHLEPFPKIQASGGCGGAAVSSGGPGGLFLGALAGCLLPLLFAGRRSFRRIALALLLGAGLPSAASAADEGLLPRSLSESWAPVDREAERSDPGDPAGLAPNLSRGTRRGSLPWISMSATVGALLMDTSFDAVGTDFVERQVTGFGTGLVGLEALLPVQRGWRVGVAGEADLWKDLRIVGGGPMVSYRMGASPSIYLDRPDVEHLLKMGLLYQALNVTKSGFGRFHPTVTARVGYELRIAITPEWYLVGDAELRYGAWKYRGSIQSGDDRLGGVAGVLSFGIAWVP